MYVSSEIVAGLHDMILLVDAGILQYFYLWKVVLMVALNLPVFFCTLVILS
jgi:hypothetical protein